MNIQTVKLAEDGGYLVNGEISVPNAAGNRHYQAVQKWIAEGNTPEPYVEPPASAPKTRFTSLEYLDRFTEQEQMDIVTAAASNVQIKLYYDRLLAATFIDLDDPRTEAGIDALIAAELLAPERKAELLTPEQQ